MKKLFIKTYGCQMNVYDSEKMADILAPLGYQLVDDPEGVDLAILNTCHIREKAEEKVFSDLGRLRPHKKTAEAEGRPMLIAVAGCVGQAVGGEILRRAPYVDIVLGPQTYHRLPEMIARAERGRSKDHQGPGRGIVEIDFPVEEKFDFIPTPSAPLGSSAFLSVQEGCDKFCTYCVVPYTRGAEYSRGAGPVLEEAKRLVDGGVKEITLLGQNVNAYHGLFGNEEWSLARLIEELALINGLEHIRYMTSHPRDMTPDLIAAHRDIPKLMPYLHLPVQAGSDRVLTAMNRHHTKDQYLRILEDLRKARPDMALSSDFIVGFPGETEQEFEETLEVVNQVRYAQSYSFKYSPRPGTPGALMDKQVPEDVKSERLGRLQALIAQHQLAFNESKLGQEMSVLFDRKGRREGQMLGRTPYLQSVFVEANPRLLGQIVRVRITQAGPNSLQGTILTDETILKRPA